MSATNQRGIQQFLGLDYKQKAQVFSSHMTVYCKYFKMCPSHLIILRLMDLPRDRAVAGIPTEACLLCVMNNFNVSITTFL